jgi:alkanesulfonate monooxygenase SsuD/methylene tetrahydromethanopterin reductase-like flavin-dependent oxidoreductase (luciferase family)
MDIGIGLPAAIAGVAGTQLLDWARCSEDYPFATISVLDRLVFPNHEPLITLAAVSAVTRRVRLMTTVLLAPLRTTALLAKQIATLDGISGGRVVLGVGVGNRTDDFDAAGADFHRRGRQLDLQIEAMRKIWEGEGSIGPAPVQAGGPRIIVGGRSDAAIRRVAALGHGWAAGGGGPEQFAEFAARVRSAWTAAGRSGSPWLVAGARFALGPGGREQAEASQQAYYTFRASPRSDPTGGALLTPEAIRESAAAFDAAGCDELIFSPGAGGLAQLEQLAKALF